MAGLNDEFLLADDSMEPKEGGVTVKAFKDTPEGETPELRDDIELIAAASEELHTAMEELAVRRRDLELLQQTIKSQGGMSQSVALEAQAIMPAFISDERPLAFFTKTPSRTQLAAALEDIGGEKKGIVRRMIDAIVNFVKKVVEKIKAFFARFKKEKVKENQAFVKTYTGPSDEQLKGLVAKYTKAAKSGHEVATEGFALALEKIPDTQAAEAAANATLDKWLEEFTKVTNKPFTRKQAALAFKKDKLDHIVKSLQNNGTVMVGAMTDGDFAKAFEQAAEFAGKMIHGSFHPDHLENYLKFSNQVADFNKKCQEVLNFMEAEDVEKRTFALGEWVLFGDKKVAGYLEIYPVSGASFEYAASFMEALSAYVQKLGTLDSELAMEKLKQAQKVVANMSAFISMNARVSYIYNQVIVAVRSM